MTRVDRKRPGPAPGKVMLALDSSTGVGSVAAGVDDRVLAERSVSVGAGHSSALLPALDGALRDAGFDRSQVGAVVVGSGPGSFTGLRIAGATAKGIVHALGTPLYAYSSLLVIATAGWASDRVVCALGDARGREVYMAIYRFGAELEVIGPPQVATVDEVVGRFGDEGGAVFVGNGALRHQAELSTLPGCVVGPAELTVPRASGLLWLARRYPAEGRVADPSEWEPDYLRASGAERIAADRARAKGAGVGGGAGA